MSTNKNKKKASKKATKKEPTKKDRDEAGKKNHAEKQAAKKGNMFVHARTKPKGAKTVKVKALCTMHCLDSNDLKIGKICEITVDEANRLENDERGPFFEKV